MVRSAGLAALVACASAFAPAPGVLPGSLSASHSQRLSAGSLSSSSPTAALRVSPGGMRKQPQQLAMNFVTHYGKSLHIRAAYILPYISVMGEFCFLVLQQRMRVILGHPLWWCI